ncbi:MAG: phosphoribosylformylglycinamidine synthase subunit PurQ [Bacteroidetes bacterium]|jgi:phosphoribosylformylglycinamidine synthase|nr:phosphoribosylformylglycinamidine synthase subunit PurQ [Bacteroidota bacterium]
MKFGVVTFPGSNCDHDTLHVLRTVMGFDTVSLWHKDHDLQGCDFVFLPGGFSYGDYLRSGAIARFSPIMESVAAHAAKGGFVMGICNGFQVLCESGLLPGALLRNAGQKFSCKNIYLRTETIQSAITQQLEKGQVLTLPIAHAEGNYYIDNAGLKSLQDHDQVLFRYCSKEGRLGEEHNPNGSLDHIAGITNAGRNVFGMMPHPERAAEGILGNKDGRKLFEGVLQMV